MSERLDLNAIKARLSALTSETWQLDGPDYHDFGSGESDYVITSLVTNDAREGIVAAIPPIEKDESAWLAWAVVANRNLEFIAHARTDVELLVREVEELRKSAPMTVLNADSTARDRSMFVYDEMAYRQRCLFEAALDGKLAED